MEKYIEHKSRFIIHLSINAIVGIILVIAALFIGMSGYHFFEHMPWVDAFVNAAMILSGMGPVATLNTYAGKIFAGCYALFSGLAFIVIIALIFTPIIHKIFRTVHLENKKYDSKLK